MAKKGYLKIAMDKTTKKGQPFVSLLVLDEPDSEDGTWMSLFDAYFFGGTDDKPSPYDIRRYADRDDPQPVVYEAEERNGFVNCLRIRPADEHWEIPDALAKGRQGPSEKFTEAPYEGSLSDVTPGRESKVALAISTIKKGLDMLKEALER